jgi:tetratricopeptide (TPR) repeat protein
MDAYAWNDADALTRRAIELIAERQFADALEDLQQAQQMDPYNAACWYNAGICLDELGRLHEAIECYQRAADIRDDDPEILNRLAVDLHQVGKTRRALEVLASIEKIDSSFEPAYCNRVHIHVELNQHEQAEEVFYLARLHKEHCPRCYYNMGCSMQTQGRYDQAARCFRRAIDLPGAAAEVHKRLAECLLAMGEADSARLHLNHSLSLEGNNVVVLMMLCDLLIEQNRYREADARVEKLLRAAPDYAPAQLLGGKLAFIRGHDTLAIERLERALELDPTLPKAHLTLARSLLRTGRTEPARVHLRAELMLQPHSQHMLMELGDLLLDVLDLDGAATCYSRVLGADERHLKALQNLGVAECEAGRHDAGIAAFRRALQIDSHQADVHHNLALALADAGNFPAALESLRHARKLLPQSELLRRLSVRLRLRRAREWFGRLLGRVQP